MSAEKPTPLNGLLLVDKPKKMTSHDVVAICRRTLGQRTIGHAGTLDPIATGLLVLLVGNATKLSDYILNGNKAYIVKIQLGLTTDTYDISGQVTSQQQSFNVTRARIEEAVSELTGTLELPVPAFSAVKVKGRKLYEKARKGEKVEAPVKTMEFFESEILDSGDHWVRVYLNCSKGSYVRSWTSQLGELLGVGATVEELRRVGSFPYELEQGAISLEELEELGRDGIHQSAAWIPLEKTLPSWPSVKIDGLEEKLLVNGQIPRRLERFLEVQYGGAPEVEGVKILSRRSGRLLSLLSHENAVSFKIRRVFPG